MKPKSKRRLKKIATFNIVLLLSITCVANSNVFAAPVTFLAKTFGKISASVLLPHKIAISEKKIESSVTPEDRSMPSTATNKSNSTDQSNTDKKQTQTKSNNTVLSNGDEAAGRIISQTIDKSGATMSYGDVYIRNLTDVNFNIKEQLSVAPELKIKLNSDKPQVLLVHTHARECFFPELSSTYKKSWGERDNDTSKNMISVGKVVKDELNKAGINTVQSTVLHDLESYEGSYDRSRETIKKYLKKYPSIKVVLDLHRDAINEDDGDKLRPIISIDKKVAGQIMMVAGCQTGSITGYPNWKKNLRFGLRLQNMLEKAYPTLARPLLFAEKKYNQDLCPNSILVEIGSQANLISEAKYSAKLFTTVLIKYLKNYS